MAYLRFSLVALVWLFHLSFHLTRGRETTKDASLIVTQQNNSAFLVDLPTQMELQTKSKMDATMQTIIRKYAVLRSFKGEYYGIQASLNVYGLPTVGNGQTSSIRIWLMNRESYNAIQVGWRVAPNEYGDHDTYFFIIWTADGNYETGCLDLSCKGFVLHNTSQLVPGYRLQPLSKYNGEQRFLTLKISKDHATGDWWLHYGSDGTKPVGYWPKSLFTSLANSATDIHIGGMATFVKGGVSPPMGSGHDAIEGEGKSASIKNTRLIDENGYLHTPSMSIFEHPFDSCYNITGEIVSTLYLGGPGGCKD